MVSKVKKEVFNIIQIGSKSDKASVAFDICIVVVIFANLFVTFFDTFDESAEYKSILNLVELVTVIIFTVEYVLRVWTSDLLFPNKKKAAATFSFIFSFYGIIDLLTFFPYYLPFVFPAGIVAFRMLRVIRIFRLFKINSQYDAFNVITEVLRVKRNQIISSVALVLILMLASSMFMYSLEHEAQPEVFTNAFSGIWWSMSTLLTIGYGDIYPVTIAGRFMAIVLSFLGVGMVAIPTGIISAGFVEQYTKIKRTSDYAEEKELKFVTSRVVNGHPWCGKEIKDVTLPPELLLIMIRRGSEIIVPRGDTELHKQDLLVFAAKHFTIPEGISLREIVVKKDHPWVDEMIRDLDISRQELIVMVERNGKTLVPNGSVRIKENDTVIMYSRKSYEG